MGLGESLLKIAVAGVLGAAAINATKDAKEYEDRYEKYDSETLLRRYKTESIISKKMAIAAELRNRGYTDLDR